ncbi:MAG: glycosyltransferase [Candidatus Rokubacteria bacterium]|nr:glycosyltransferase [Candidatus Rokubacteria bacterium]
MKILAVVSALDLRLAVGATSAWWQLFKGLYEVGAEVVATPYAGEPVESPWWRAYPNPCRHEARAFVALAAAQARLRRARPGARASALVRALVRGWVLPRWQRHLTRVLEAERDVDAVLVVNVPANHFTGLPALLRRRFSVPVFYLDGDMPMSLPAFGGYASGVRGYDLADLSEYDAVITNSRAAGAEMLRMGARQAHTLHFAADADLFFPAAVAEDVDVFFYGFGAEQREGAIRHMVAQPSRDLPARFVVGGARLVADLGRAERIGPVPTSRLRHWAGRSRLNLNIVRRPHATFAASSCMRLFELAAMACCVVSNPTAGIEEWLEPDREVVVAPEDEPAAGLYRALLADPGRRRAIGEAARRRVLEEHTYRHRARTLVSYLGGPARS